jgi:hypothetical protein
VTGTSFEESGCGEDGCGRDGDGSVCGVSECFDSAEGGDGVDPGYWDGSSMNEFNIETDLWNSNSREVNYFSRLPYDG